MKDDLLRSGMKQFTFFGTKFSFYEKVLRKTATNVVHPEDEYEYEDPKRFPVLTIKRQMAYAAKDAVLADEHQRIGLTVRLPKKKNQTPHSGKPGIWISKFVSLIPRRPFWESGKNHSKKFRNSSHFSGEGSNSIMEGLIGRCLVMFVLNLSQMFFLCLFQFQIDDQRFVFLEVDFEIFFFSFVFLF